MSVASKLFPKETQNTALGKSCWYSREKCRPIHPFPPHPLSSFPRMAEEVNHMPTTEAELTFRTGFIFVLAQAGGALFPSVTGLIATHAGVAVLQPIVLALIAVGAVTWWLVPKPPPRTD